MNFRLIATVSVFTYINILGVASNSSMALTHSNHLFLPRSNTSTLAQTTGVIDITADNTADGSLGIDKSPGETFVFRCPPPNLSNQIWGTGIYSGGSTICTAALHAGMINRNGGVVKLKSLGPQSGFRQTQRNGVLSRAYGQFSSSFRFLR